MLDAIYRLEAAGGTQPWSGLSASSRSSPRSDAIYFADRRRVRPLGRRSDRPPQPGQERGPHPRDDVRQQGCRGSRARSRPTPAEHTTTSRAQVIVHPGALLVDRPGRLGALSPLTLTLPPARLQARPRHTRRQFAGGTSGRSAAAAAWYALAPPERSVKERLAQEQALPRFGTPGAGDKAVASRVPELLYAAASPRADTTWLRRRGTGLRRPFRAHRLLSRRCSGPRALVAAGLAGPTPVAISGGQQLRCCLVRGGASGASARPWRKHGVGQVAS